MRSRNASERNVNVTRPRFDYSDQAFARWMIWWFRRVRDWNQVLFLARQKWPEEQDSKLRELLSRARGAFKAMPPAWIWSGTNPGESFPHVPRRVDHG